MTRDLQVLIVEDEPFIAEDLATMLGDLGHAVSGRARDAAEALRLLQAHTPHLVLLDIRLGDGPDGFTVAAALQERGIPFLYVTSHTDADTLARMGDTRPAGFIRKPFDEEDLRAQLAVALARTAPAGAADLFVRDRGRLLRLPVNDVLFAEADDNYVILHTADRRHVLVATLAQLHARLGPQAFARVHRSYLVNLHRVSALHDGHVLVGPHRVPVGRTHRDALKARLRIGGTADR